MHSLIKVLREGQRFAFNRSIVCENIASLLGQEKLQMVSDGRNNNCLSLNIDIKEFIVHEHKTMFGLNFLVQTQCRPPSSTVNCLTSQFLCCALLDLFLILLHFFQQNLVDSKRSQSFLLFTLRLTFRCKSQQKQAT